MNRSEPSLPLPEPPAWALEAAPHGQPLSEEELVRAAIALSRETIRRTGGGPFGAVVARADGRIVAAGWNQVRPWLDASAHAELNALRRAQRVLGVESLRDASLPRLRLVTSCAPCLMCTGAILWAGVPEVIAAAGTADAEALGFDEGVEDLDVPAFLARRSIQYREGLLREEAVAVLREYRGPIYNA